MNFINWFNWLITLYLAALISACSVNLSLPEDSPYWGGYKYEQVYIIEKNIFLMKSDYYGEYLIPERNYKGRSIGRYQLAPKSIEEYKKDPVTSSIYERKRNQLSKSKYEELLKKYRNDPTKLSAIKRMHGPRKLNVLGIVNAGTKIKAMKITNKKSWVPGFGESERIFVYGELLTGPFSGRLVDIRDISIYYNNGDVNKYIYKPENGLITVEK